MRRAQPFASEVLLVLLVAITAAIAPPARAQQTSPTVDPSQYAALRWRLIGPYRAGRVSAVAGVPGDPTTYYMGLPGGGIWKTTNAGVTWRPIFDQAHLASIGDIAVAPSHPNIVIAGTGEQTDGHGVYRSTDAGATWTNIGLEDTKYISTVIIDPRNPDIILVGVWDHPILGVGLPNKLRGVYKTTNGGKTWAHTLFRDELAGISNMAADPSNPKILYAGMWKPFDFRAGPPEKMTQSSWIYKSVDEGSTWAPVSEDGLQPTHATVSDFPLPREPRASVCSRSCLRDYTVRTMAARTGARSPRIRALPGTSIFAASTSIQKMRTRCT